MSKHIAPSTSCNLGCTYCYEEPDREIRKADMVHEYDMDAILERLREWKQQDPNDPPGLHGGEPMLMKDDDLERIFEWIHNNYDGDGGHIQTNATLIKDKHIEIFQKYNVGVGISCDGPPELNAEREARQGGEDVTDDMSVLTGRAITRLREANVNVGLIVVLHTTNAGTNEKFEKLLSWMDNMCQMGVTGHFNPAIPYEDVQTDISLDTDTLRDRYIRTWEWMNERGKGYRTWNPMRYYQDNLLGLGLGNCVNNKCDIAGAGAAEIVKGNGETTGCGKTWSAYGDGVPFLQGPSNDSEYGDGEERYEMLKKVPGWVTEDEPDMGGCKGCKYWNICQGGCPPSGENEDYRNRTVDCKAKYGLYERIEQDMRQMFPRVRLITDIPWDADISEMQKGYQLNIHPFANMRHDMADRPSVFRWTQHDGKDPIDYVPDDKLNESKWDRKVKNAKEKYGENNVEIDHESQTIHADSAPMSDGDGWKPVNDEDNQ